VAVLGAAVLGAATVCLATVGRGAPLGTNLVANAGFENLGTVTEPQYGLSNILTWNGPGFAQAHSAGGWANGAPLTSGGNYYYAGGGYTISQDISLAAGDTEAAIATGRGEFDLSAWFSGFSSQTDTATIHVAFLDGSSAPVGQAVTLSTPDTATWSEGAVRGKIPLAASTARLSITSQGFGWADGYVDNVLFQVLQGAAPLGLMVDQATGDITLTNPNSTGAIEIDFYEIVSPSGSLLASWDSLQAQGIDSMGNGPGQHWSQGAGVSSRILTEVFLLGTSELAASGSLTLAGAFNPLSTFQDLEFRYGLAADGDEVHRGTVSYQGASPTFLLGDLDADGDIDRFDWVALRSNQHADLSGFSILEAYLHGDLDGDGANDYADFVLFKSAYEAAHGPGAFVTLLATVPEPTSVGLVVACLLGTMRAYRRTSLTLRAS
jgi:hypothetical protein